MIPPLRRRKVRTPGAAVPGRAAQGESVQDRRWGARLTCVVALTVLGACSSNSGSESGADAGDGATSTGAVKVTVVSSRPDMVSGGDALLEIAGGTGTPTAKIGDKPAPLTEVGGKWWRITGLPDGKATIAVARGDETASVEVENFPISGPVFSGPHMPLLVCSTDKFGLGPATDKNCSAKTARDTTTITTSKSQSLQIEQEKGVINRAIYWITKPAGDAWNGRLLYRYGGGCGTSFGQG